MVYQTRTPEDCDILLITMGQSPLYVHDLQNVEYLILDLSSRILTG